MKIPEEAKNYLYEVFIKIGKTVTEKSETKMTENKMDSDDINKVNGHYRWETESYLKKVEKDRKEERKKQEEREAMIEKWRRKHGK